MSDPDEVSGLGPLRRAAIMIDSAIREAAAFQRDRDLDRLRVAQKEYELVVEQRDLTREQRDLTEEQRNLIRLMATDSAQVKKDTRRLLLLTALLLIVAVVTIAIAA